MERVNAGRKTMVSAGVVAVAPATWWAAGVLSSRKEIVNPDYAVSPLDISSTVEAAIGVTALLVVGMGVAAFVGAVTRGCWRSAWVAVVAPLALLAAYVGLTYSVVTAPGTGANIGAGMLALAGFPVTAYLLGSALYNTLRLRRQASDPG